MRKKWRKWFVCISKWYHFCLFRSNIRIILFLSYMRWFHLVNDTQIYLSVCRTEWTNDEPAACHCLASIITQLTLFISRGLNRFHRTFLIISMCSSKNSLSKYVSFNISLIKLSLSNEKSKKLNTLLSTPRFYSNHWNIILYLLCLLHLKRKCSKLFQAHYH